MLRAYRSVLLRLSKLVYTTSPCLPSIMDRFNGQNHRSNNDNPERDPFFAANHYGILDDSARRSSSSSPAFESHRQLGPPASPSTSSSSSGSGESDSDDSSSGSSSGSSSPYSSRSPSLFSSSSSSQSAPPSPLRDIAPHILALHLFPHQVAGFGPVGPDIEILAPPAVDLPPNMADFDVFAPRLNALPIERDAELGGLQRIGPPLRMGAPQPLGELPRLDREARVDPIIYEIEDSPEPEIIPPVIINDPNGDFPIGRRFRESSSPDIFHIRLGDEHSPTPPEHFGSYLLRRRENRLRRNRKMSAPLKPREQRREGLRRIRSKPAPVKKSKELVFFEKLAKKFARRASYMPPRHPTYMKMVVTALKKLNNRRGATKDAIMKYLRENYHLSAYHNKTETFVCAAIQKLRKFKRIIASKGKGYRASFRLASDKVLKRKIREKVEVEPKKERMVYLPLNQEKRKRLPPYEKMIIQTLKGLEKRNRSECDVRSFIKYIQIYYHADTNANRIRQYCQKALRRLVEKNSVSYNSSNSSYKLTDAGRAANKRQAYLPIYIFASELSCCPVSRMRNRNCSDIERSRIRLRELVFARETYRPNGSVHLPN